MNEVLIICGSKSDERIAEKTTKTLDDLGISYALEFASAHREPERVKKLVAESNAEVIIAIAGLAAALPGFVASITDRPVIGVPVSAALGGLDALLSIVQMPKGVPVAAVGVDNGQNAAHLAARILGASKTSSSVPSSYREAGVDEDLVSGGLRVLGKFVEKSFSFGRVMQKYGHYANTVMVGDDLCLSLSTDGVGSKVLVAEMAGKYDTIGIDCVAMNVNDLICVGSTPVGFVDYLASEAPLPEAVMEQIGKGLLEGCRQSEIPILGGETAILPDMIRGVKGPGLDLAGTAVGVARLEDLIDSSQIQQGDAIIGIESNGIHSNGFTLARKVMFSKYQVSDELPWGITVGDELLRPTRIYVKHFKELNSAGIKIHGLAHITGSGFKKVLRLGEHCFRISHMPETPPVFETIKSIGNIPISEMFATFNMGVGMVVIVADDDKQKTRAVLGEIDEVYELGVVESSTKGTVVIEPHGVEIS